MASMFSDALLALVYAIVGIVVILALLILRQRSLWSVYSVVAVINAMPNTFPIPPAQALSIANVISDPRRSLSFVTRFIPACFLGLTVSFVFALAWSPQPRSGWAVITASLSVTAAIVFALRTAEDNPRLDLLHWTMILTAPIAVAQSVATTVFRLRPDIELTYFRSEIFYFLLGDSGRNLLSTMSNNVLSDDKAGGLLFVNGNRASMVMAAWGLAYLSLWLHKRSTAMFLLGAICLTGTAMTSSKTAIILLATLPALLILLPGLVRVRRNPLVFLVSAVGMAGVATVLYRLADLVPERLAGAETSSQDRLNFWTAALGYFHDSPWLGLGHGGWFQRWAMDAGKYDMLATYPPHNVILSIWTNAGLLALGFAGLAVGGIFIGYLRALGGAPDARTALAVSFELGVVTWMLAHAMFDNTDIYGVYNTIPLFAIIAARANGYLSSSKRGRDVPWEPGTHGDTTQRSVSRASSVSETGASLAMLPPVEVFTPRPTGGVST